MTTNYFETCKTIDEAKKKFYELAKIHHPDKGGDTAIMQEILNQFDKFSPSSEKFTGEKEQFSSMEYAAIINELMSIPEIVIEIIGSFVWISGNTKPYKDMIKEVNLKGEKFPTYKQAMWHATKCLWYFSPTTYRRFSKGSYSLDEIRNMYGSHTVKKNERRQVA